MKPTETFSQQQPRSEISDVSQQQHVEFASERMPKKSTISVRSMETVRSRTSLGSKELANWHKTLKKYCCTHGIQRHSIPLLLALVAFAFTFTGSWSCHYFKGATTGFTGSKYGLWTLQDMHGHCQLWNVVFFHYSLGKILKATRAFSMTAMILGLSLVTAMSQALKCHVVSWGLGLALLVLFIVSLATAQKFNLWTVFFLFLYVELVLIVRSLFIHPVHRAISKRGSMYIACLLLFNFILTISTVWVLASDFCQCEKLTVERLEGRPDPSHDLCKNECDLGPGGIIMILGSIFWIFAGIAVFCFGVQPKDFQTEDNDLFAGYSKDSFTTKITKSAIVVVDNIDKSTRVVKEKVKSVLSPKEVPPDLEPGDSTGVFAANEEEPPPSVSERPLSGRTVSSWSIRSDHLTLTQKLCCDFRVAERSKWKKAEFWCFRLSLVALFGVFIFVVVVLIGSKIENGIAETLPSTRSSFVTNVTCAFNESDMNASFMTYNTPDEAHAANMTVAHCGRCGECSNIHDVEVYLETRKTITKETKQCGKTAVLGSREDVDQCMKERINFTDNCRSCWVDNVKCDTKNCLFTCMTTYFTGYLAHNNVPQSGDQGRLNWCLHCDERRCGTAFIECSGSARRRLGISSAIERDPEEICQNVDYNWEAKYPVDSGPSLSESSLLLSSIAVVLATMISFT